MSTQPMSIRQGEQNVRLVMIPANASSRRKGTTAYDLHFDHLLKFEQAMQMPEHEFEGVRKAATRFLQNKGLTDTISVRQKKDHRTKTYLLWFINQPPVKRKAKP